MLGEKIIIIYIHLMPATRRYDINSIFCRGVRMSISIIHNVCGIEMTSPSNTVTNPKTL